MFMVDGRALQEAMEMLKYRGATRFTCSEGKMVAASNGEYVTFEQYRAAIDEMRKAVSELDDLKFKAQQLFGFKPEYREPERSWRD